jgi:hypothetical protein
MQPNLKHYADYFSMSLAVGLCSHTEIIAWVDQLIEHEDQPEDWMIELSTSASKLSFRGKECRDFYETIDRQVRHSVSTPAS